MNTEEQEQEQDPSSSSSDNENAEEVEVLGIDERVVVEDEEEEEEEEESDDEDFLDANEDVAEVVEEEYNNRSATVTATATASSNTNADTDTGSTSTSTSSGGDFYHDVFSDSEYFSNGNPGNASDASDRDNDSNASNDSNNADAANVNVNVNVNVPIAPARNHSYLPGITNPLYPEQWLLQSQFQHQNPNRNPNQNQHTTIARSTSTSTSISASTGPRPVRIASKTTETTWIPILQLEGVVLFPNSTIPLRLTDTSWVRYLSRQISFARHGGVGFSCDTHRHSSGDGNADANGNGINNGGIDIDNDGDVQVRIGIVTKLNSVRRRRRRIYDISREDQNQNQNQDHRDHYYQRRRRNRRNLNSNNDSSTNNNNNNSNNDGTNTGTNVREGSARMGRWNLEMIRRGILLHRNHSSNFNGNNSASDGDIDNDDSDDDDDDNNNNNNNNNGNNNARHERYLQHHPINDFSSTSSDPLWSRIGTFATITYTHEDDSNTAQQGTRRIIVTALSTGRFRILDSEPSDESQDCPKMYQVEELNEDIMNVPFMVSKQRKPHYHEPKDEEVNLNLQAKGKAEQTRTCRDDILNEEDDTFTTTNTGGNFETQEEEESFIYQRSHIKMIQDLSKVSPFPSFIYRKAWPWMLAEQIVNEIAFNDTLDGLWNSLPPSSGRYIIPSKTEGGKSSTDPIQRQQQADKVNRSRQHRIRYGIDRSQCDPISFSFWVATNLPLSQMNKLDILEMSIVERLRYLLDKLIKQRNVIRDIKCKQCGSKVSKMSNLFSVAGAEGTSGAYVNEHGCIHQTITVKSVEDNNMLYFGGEETRDSWFPGYSWTIMCCYTCSGHLGWKFKRVCQSNAGEGTGPRIFWGLSGSNVTTGKSSPRRIFHRH